MPVAEKNFRLSFAHCNCVGSVKMRAVMIDLDGTMVNTLGDFDLALNSMLDEQKWPRVDRTFIARTVGKGSHYLIRQTLLHLGLGHDGAINDALYERAHANYQQHYGRINGRESFLYPGVQEGLAQFYAAGLPLACITNKPTEHAIKLLQMLGIGQYFIHVHGGDRFVRRKPDPMPLVETAKILGCQPHQTLMIGDSANDSQAAHEAGCPVLLVRYGYNHGEPIDRVPAQGYLEKISDLRCVQESL